MRNWNSGTIQARKERFQLPDYLWGIETSVKKKGKQKKLVASRLPMRNWNALKTMQDFEMIEASRLPMRNWNFSVLNSSICSSASFQTTYEELKLPDTTFAWTVLARFQTTYEELKLVQHFKGRFHNCELPDYLWGIETASFTNVFFLGIILSFQTTYEELKLIYEPTLGFWRGRFQTTYEELKPYSRSGPGGGPSLLPDYLWGIETC